MKNRPSLKQFSLRLSDISLRRYCLKTFFKSGGWPCRGRGGVYNTQWVQTCTLGNLLISLNSLNIRRKTWRRFLFIFGRSFICPLLSSTQRFSLLEIILQQLLFPLKLSENILMNSGGKSCCRILSSNEINGNIDSKWVKRFLGQTN